MSVPVFDGMAEEYKLVQDHKRELDQRHKWAHGEAEGVRGPTSKRPVKPEKQSVRRVIRHGNVKIHNKTVGGRVWRNPSGAGDDVTTSDSSAAEEVQEASAAPVPDAGITYSFDAPRGPSRGSQILSLAITKAVERFETKETEKLVKEEYEVIGKESEPDHGGYTADEDDFELI